MPVPLAVDREAVKTHALAHGLADAAKAFGVQYETVRKWSSRGEWMKDAGAVTVLQELPPTMRPRAVTSVPVSPSAAMKDSLERLGAKSKLAVAKYGARVLPHAAKVAKRAPEMALGMAGDVKSVVSSLQTANVPGFEREARDTKVSINILNMGEPEMLPSVEIIEHDPMHDPAF